MDLQKARKIIEEDAIKRNHSLKNEIFKGMEILLKYTEDLKLAAGHDQIWCGDFEETVQKMTEEDFVRMITLGWFEDEDSWSAFC